jgi:tetratricopeptide (TPR) repeat protein
METVRARASRPLPTMSRPLPTCFLVLAAAAGAAWAQPPAAPPETASGTSASADPSALLADAVRQQQQGDYAGAAAAYERVIAFGFDDPTLRSNLGAAYAALGRYDEAIDQYRQALARDAGNVAIRRNLALAYYKTGRMEEAAAAAEAVVDAQPSNDSARLLLADCAYRLGQNQRVIDLLQPLVGHTTQDRAVSYLLGMALIGENRMADAQAAIDRVLRDDSPETHVFLAMMYLRDGDCAKAEPEIRRALDANPRLPLVNFLNGQCLMDERHSDWPGAIEAFKAELSVDPNHFEANLYLGDLLREGARHDEALPYLERARRLRPDSLAAKFSLGAAYVALGRTEEALPLLEAVAQGAPDHLQTHMQLAIVYTRLGRTGDAQREKEAVGRLASEGENRFFKGVSDALARLLATTDHEKATGHEKAADPKKP